MVNTNSKQFSPLFFNLLSDSQVLSKSKENTVEHKEFGCDISSNEHLFEPFGYSNDEQFFGLMDD